MTDGVRIELDPGAQPVAGRILPATGEPLPFAGYVELIAALERMRLGEECDADDRADADGSHRGRG